MTLNVEEAKARQHNIWAGLYGMVIIVLAFVMSMTTCLTAKSPKDALFHLSYHFILYVIGFVMFAYVYFDVIRPYEKKIKQEKSKVESDEPKEHQAEAEEYQAEQPQAEAEEYQAEEYQAEQHQAEQHQAEQHQAEAKVERDEPGLDEQPCPAAVENNDQQEPQVKIGKVPDVYYEDKGVHFYLRIGLLLFGVGSMIQDGFKLSILFEVSYDCLATLFVPTAALRMLYILVQIWFLFKYHRLVVNTKKLAVRFCYAHLMGTSVGIWLWVVMEESVREIQIHTALHMTPGGKGPGAHGPITSDHGPPADLHESHDVHRRAAADINSNDTQELLGMLLTTVAQSVIYPGPHDDPDTDEHPADHDEDVGHDLYNGPPTGGPPGGSCRVPDSLAWKAAPFLAPCFVEFGLISFAIIYRLYGHIGGRVKTVPAVIAETKIDGRTVLPGVSHCHRANKGLFLGCFVILSMIVGLAVYFTHQPHFEYGKMEGHIYFFRIVEDIIILCSFASVVVSFIGMRELRVMDSSEVDTEVNGALMIVTYLGSILYDAFKIVSCISYLARKEYKTFVSYALVNAALSAIQSTAQSLFLLGALRRRARSLEHVNDKPGRNALTFLLACNLALWISIIFETKKFDTHQMNEEFYSFLAWTIITFTCVPLNILYRFHSTVCLAEIWGSAYSIKDKAM